VKTLKKMFINLMLVLFTMTIFMPITLFARTRTINTINSENELHMSIDSLGFLDWDDVDGATGYVVELTQPNVTSLNSWETTESIIPLISYIDQLKYSSGQYTIIVSAKGVSSDASMSYYYTSNVDQLEAPNGLIWDGNIARWNAVSGASVYNVELLNYDGRVTLQSTNNTSFDFSGFSPEDGWTFKVQAKPEASGTLSAKRDSLFIESPAYEEVAKYTVTYDANGGSGLMEIENLTVENDGFAKNYTFPECEFTAPSGKEFDKWQWYYNSNPSSTNETTPGNNPWISGNITVKALWKEITTYIVTYDANGGSGTMEIENLTVENDGFAKNYTFPECGFTAPSGKEFDKWQWYYNSDPSATYETTPGNNPWISGNITVKALWKDITYTVTFNSNGGSAVTTQTVVAGGKAIRPDDPTKENRTFGLWYKDEDLTEQFSFENETITKDTILYAKWKVSVFVHTYNETTDEQDTDIPGTFKIPEFGVDGHNNAFQCTEGQEYKIKATPKTGYRFVEWRSGKKDGDTVSKDVEYTFTAPIITLYAVFEAEQVQPATYTVTFNSNGGSAVATIENVTSGEKISKPTDPTRTGYTFAGWYKESELTNEFNFATDTITSDTTLYAKWEEVVPATITTISVGNVDMPEVGESSDDLTNTPATLTYGDSYQMAGFGIKVKNGDSWDDYNGEENVIEAGKTYRVEITLEATSEKLFDSEITDANITVNGEAGKLVEFYNNYQMVKISKEFSYAAPATYTVTFNSNGGSAVATIENVTSGEKISKPTDPTRTGYTFAGWYKESELTNEFNFATDTITSDTTLFAKWNKKQTTGGGGGGSATTKYTITVKQNDNGKISPETTKVEKGDNQKFEIKADKGYEVEKVLVDGKSVGAVTEYTFEKVKEKHTIEATFKKVEEVTEETWKNPFTDVTEDDWFYEAVKYANENKLFNGVSSTEFGPNVSMTRAMLVTVLYRLEGEPATNRSIPFADVDMSMYYANAVIWAKQNNIVNGVDETNFAPNLEVTREQLVTVLYRYAQYKGKDVSVGENTNILSYDDFSELSEYAIPAMQWACGSGIITGRTISTIAPKGTATRAEVATMLMRFTK